MKKTIAICCILVFFGSCSNSKKCATYNPDKTYKARYNKNGLIKK